MPRPNRAPYRDLLGIVPFALFALAFLIAPSFAIFVRSFQDASGGFTFDNILGLAQKSIRDSYWVSMRLSFVTALIGAVFGFMVAYAIILGGTPRWLRNGFMTFSGVASNFAGVPLAFAFISTLGRLGMLTVVLKTLGLDLYSGGFSLYTFWGLALTYVYFQLPLALLILAPALDGLKKQWREASENLGASSWQYWRHIAFPILTPALLSMFILLFGNAFGAYATAYALTGGQLNLVTILIGSQIQGDVFNNQGLGNALALGMIVIMGLSVALYSALQSRTARWLR
jgi:putative spermidine/putrescine transport system permease protein